MAPEIPGLPSSVSYIYVKRSLDLLLGGVLTIIAIPVMVLISLLVLIDSGWPVFYTQQRVGARACRRGGQTIWQERRFRIFKFRTMVRGADRSTVHEHFVAAFVGGTDTSGSGFKLSGDARVTRIGRLLRATSLDELPQLLNVLTGRMSLVGPRPVPPYEVALYQPEQRERLAAIPGITGAWQVAGRGRVGFEEMVKLDIEYVRRRSLRLDLSLLLRTVGAISSRRGAR